MANLRKLCRGKANSIWVDNYSKLEKLGYYESLGNHHAYHNVKRIRMKCLFCGRKVWSSIWNTEDGDLIHVLPPHKKKKWWKKGWKK